MTHHETRFIHLHDATYQEFIDLVRDFEAQIEAPATYSPTPDARPALCATIENDRRLDLRVHIFYSPNDR